MVAIFKDYYYILGVSHFSSKSEINLAYKTLVREYHPDRNRQLTKEESTIKTALLNEAREYLNNDVLRKAYDTNYINRFNLRLPVKYQKLFDEEWIPFKKKFRVLDEIVDDFDFRTKKWGSGGGMKVDDHGNVWVNKSGGYHDEWQGNDESPFSYIKYHAQHIKGNSFEQDKKRKVNEEVINTIDKNNNKYVFVVEKKDDGFYYFCGLYKCDRYIKEWDAIVRENRLVFFLKSINLNVNDSVKFTGKVLTTIHWNELTTKEIYNKLGSSGIANEIHNHINQMHDVHSQTIDSDLNQLWMAYNEIKNNISIKLGRTQNVVGEFAEYLVKLFYRGELLPPSTKSADVITEDKKLIQVKAREVKTINFSTTLSNIRSWDFDLLVYTIFHHTGELISAGEIKCDIAKTMSRYTHHVNANIITVSNSTIKSNNVKDITDNLIKLFPTRKI